MGSYYKVHPAIGIARVGNADLDSADAGTFYLSPEVPSQVPNQAKPYKSGGKIKKQGQRFRIYEYDDTTHAAIREITLDCEDVAYIKWTVRLANSKCALNSNLPPAGRRNQDPVYLNKRKYLTIDSKRPNKNDPDATVENVVGRTKMSSKSGFFKDWANLQGFVKFKKGNALDDGTTVKLGRIEAQSDGRLLVFAGDGVTKSPHDEPLANTFNNSGWYDDTADGVVRAEIEFKSGWTKVDATEARIICSLPRYAPAIEPMVTLWDVCKEVFYDGGAVEPPSFWRDIYPILVRTARHQWVSGVALAGHGDGRPGDFVSPGQIQLLMSKNNAAATARRKAIVARLRDPANPNGPDAKNMPILYGVTTVPRTGPSGVGFDLEHFTMTKLQYAQLQAWAEDNFDNSDDPYPATLADLDISQQPDALDRAAMDGCLARAFYPGIECCYRIEMAENYDPGTQRIMPSKPPGFLSQGNALPWQTDYMACSLHWWPSQRPNLIYRKIDGTYTANQGWMDGVSSGKDLIAKWSDLGFIVQEGSLFVESERNLDLSPGHLTG